jgi:hypothetical protein
MHLNRFRWKPHSAPSASMALQASGERRIGIVVSDHTEDGVTVFRQACKTGLERYRLEALGALFCLGRLLEPNASVASRFLR